MTVRVRLRLSVRGSAEAAHRAWRGQTQPAAPPQLVRVRVRVRVRVAPG